MSDECHTQIKTVCNTTVSMQTTPRDFEQIEGVLAAADEPLTAREILANVTDADDETAFESPHQLATVLGRRAKTGEITVIAKQPYRYTLEES